MRAELKKAETRRLFCRTSGTGFIEQLDSPRGVSAAPPPGSAPASPRGATPRGGGGGGGGGGPGGTPALGLRASRSVLRLTQAVGRHRERTVRGEP